jgi:hypothetical protein
MFSAELAGDLPGKTILICITEHDDSGSVARRVELHGTILSADPHSGITVQLAGKRAGRTHLLPADTDTFRKARPGRYHLPSTGECIDNPDYLSFWVIKRP